MQRAAKVDANQKQIVKETRAIGATVLIVSQLKNLFDIIVCYRGKTHLVEIKDGSKPPSARKLTEGELKCKDSLERVNVNYNVICSMDEMIELICS